MPFHMPVLLPFRDRIRGELGAVVRHYHARIAPHLGNPVQLPGNTHARQRRIGNRGQAFPAEVVDHVQDAEPAPLGKRVRHEVQAPPLVSAPAGSP